MTSRKKASQPLEILVPTDFSAGSARAMQYAMDMCGGKCRVTAVHAVDPFPYAYGPVKSRRLKRRRALALAHEVFAGWVKGKFLGSDKIVIEGEPAPAIIKYAAAEAADVIVLATSARRLAARIVLGSVAEEIFGAVKCPVVVIGPKAHPFKERRVARLIFATNLEPHSVATLPQLSQIGGRIPSEISVIRAVHPDIKSRTERSRIRKDTELQVKRASDSRLRKHIKEIHVAFDHPVRAITAFANARKADAIVMGIRSRGDLSRAATHIPWALAHRVIAKAQCAVLIIRS